MIKITVSNATYKKGEIVATSEEIHEILGLQNLDHIFATIESIAKNNNKYKKPEQILDSITVSMSFTQKETLKRIIDHYDDNPLFCTIKPGLYLIN